ncbi:type II CRISPR RNA-guided endonuclease Cas9 [Helicobacter sp. 13S00401-1]|uniref:type II CRISPR RNA-guided endonuclease Cas9 n=1 Tax=Helicobacter sp. 13S00401-1 TaxID=1905758 RepID=UPI000BA5B73A|nr:type II CRISPR RNA-guided endonuclease Cas9 [Helicobacter sp. 13S00401-1]PAF50704.1 type II CRISPR RNA-guided endonuclease Cas9 [Helicobacter sp. 13S00401-1]
MGKDNVKTKKVLGLDIGTESIGYAIVEIHESTKKDKERERECKEKSHIVLSGVRLFDKLSEDRFSVPLSAVRRANKSNRNRFVRRHKRMQEMESIFRDIGFLNSDYDHDSFFINFLGKIRKTRDNKTLVPYNLRELGIKERLEKDEIFAIMYHICRHRGYRSGPVLEESKKKKDTDKEGSKTKIINAKKHMGDSTFGAYLVKKAAEVETQPAYKKYRNVSMADKDMIEDEVRKILQKQAEFYKELDSNFIDKVVDIINYKAPALSTEQLIKMLGKCTFEKDELRAPKHALTTILSVLLQKLNNLKFDDKSLSTEHLSILTSLFFEKGCQLTYKDLRDVLILQAKFKDINYAQKCQEFIKKGLEGCKLSDESTIKTFPALRYQLASSINDETNFISLLESSLDKNGNIPDYKKFYSKIKKDYEAIEKNEIFYKQDKIKKILEHYSVNDLASALGNREYVDSIVEIFSIQKDYVTFQEKLQKELDSQGRLELEESLIGLFESGILGTSNLSLKALKNIEPFLLQGQKYIEACQSAGYKLQDNTKKYKHLPTITKAQKENLIFATNPKLRKIANQVVILINTILKKRHKFDYVHIELARDLPKTEEEKRREIEQNKFFKNENENAKQLVDKNASKKTWLKARLLLNQDYQCPYCKDENGNPKKLNKHELDSYEIDHIIPYSISFDNSFSNKILVHRDCNQKKGNRIPMLMFTNDEDKEAYISGVKILHLQKTKEANLLITKEELETKLEDSLKSGRVLSDTRYAGKFIKNYIERHLQFEGNCSDLTDKNEDGTTRQRVYVRNGNTTTIMRNLWHIGTQEKNEDSVSIERYKKDRKLHTHHAEDAIIIACTTQSIIQKVSNEAIKHESDFTNGEEAKSKNAKIEKALLKALHNSEPILNMKEKVRQNLQEIFPSRKVDRLKEHGDTHEETINSIRYKKDGRYLKVTKDMFQQLKINPIPTLSIPLESLNIESLELLYGKDDNNKKLYSLLKEFLQNEKKKDCPAYKKLLKIFQKKEEVELLKCEIVIKDLSKYSAENLVVIKRVLLRDLLSKLDIKGEKDKSKIKQNINETLESLVQKDSGAKYLYNLLVTYIIRDEGDENSTSFKPLLDYFHKKNKVELLECKISIEDKGTDNNIVNKLFVRDGVANKGSQQKFLLYKTKKDTFHIGVVYFSDKIKDDKTAKVQIVAKIPYDKRDMSNKIDESGNLVYKYVDTLYKNDLIYYEIKEDNKTKEYVYYLSGIDITNAQVNLIHPIIHQKLALVKGGKLTEQIEQKTPTIGGLQAKIVRLEKLQVDVLGKVYRRNKEGRYVYFPKAKKIMLRDLREYGEEQAKLIRSYKAKE